MGKLRDFIHDTEQKWDETRIRIKEKLGLFDPVIIYPYRGYANKNRAVISGRILEKEKRIHEQEISEGDLWHNIRKAIDRYESDEVPGVELSGKFMGHHAECTSGPDGYFLMEFEWDEPLEKPTGWYTATLTIEHMPLDLEYEETAQAEVLVVSRGHSFGIISDVDDTILRSNVTNPVEKISTLIRYNAKERPPFEGVGELYRQLVGGGQGNPLFFISGSSYNLYDLLTNFCHHHNIPKAPFLLRNLGLTPDQWLKKATMKYKLQHFDQIMPFFPEMSFILIGDSGQKDPEIYSEVYKKYPGQIKAIYIRHVESEERAAEISQLNKEMDIDMVLMEHSRDALQHAREQGWVK